VPTYSIRYEGGPARVGALAQELREAGVEVEYEPPTEERGAGQIAQDVVIGIAANGAYEAIKTAIARFREHHPHSIVELEEDDGDDLPT
jgi:hypothetical protein